MSTSMYILITLFLSSVSISFFAGWYFGRRQMYRRVFRRNLKVYAGGLTRRDVQ